MITEVIYKELFPFRSGPVRVEPFPTPMVRYLEKEGLVEASDHAIDGLSIIPVEWAITVPGLVALAEFEECRARQLAEETKRIEEDRKKLAEQKRQSAQQNAISAIAPVVAPILTALITFVLGVLAEHFLEIVRLLAG